MTAPNYPPQPTTIRSHVDFEMLFRTHYSSLCAYGNHILKDVDAAEEVVQEVMLKIWTNRKDLKIDTSIQSYLFRSVRNGCLNVLKHEDIRKEYRVHTEKKSVETMHSVEDNLIATELEGRIRKAIDDLPMERKKIFILSRYEGLTYGQIAEKLGISVKTVENQMGNALKTLREELSEYLPWILLILGNPNIFKL